MNLIKMIALAVAWLVLSQTGQPLLAQAQAQKPSARERPPARGFVKLDQGVWVLRLFQTKVSRGGEVAVLRLSNEKFESFRKDPRKFVNETYKDRIFLFQVRDVIRATHPGQKSIGNDPKDAVVVTLNHDGTCLSAYLAVQGP